MTVFVISYWKSLLLIGYQQICHWFLSRAIGKNQRALWNRSLRAFRLDTAQLSLTIQNFAVKFKTMKKNTLSDNNTFSIVIPPPPFHFLQGVSRIDPTWMYYTVHAPVPPPPPPSPSSFKMVKKHPNGNIIAKVTPPPFFFLSFLPIT